MKSVVVDICRPCRSVWLDGGELGWVAPAIARRQASPGALAPAPRSGRAVLPAASGAPDVSAIDLLLVPDGVDAMVAGARAAGEVAVQAPEAIQAAGEAAVTVVEVAGQGAVEAVAGAAEAGAAGLEVVFEILGSIDL